MKLKWQILEYKIVTWKYTHELYNNVHTQINKWYQPYWNVFEWYPTHEFLHKELCQAMVSYQN